MLNQPVVLSYSHSDALGGSGIQADIETIASLGSFCAPIITGIIPYGQHRQYAASFNSSPSIVDQTLAVLQEMPVSAIKIGYLGNEKVVDELSDVLLRYAAEIPIVVSPSFFDLQHDLGIYRRLLPKLAPFTCILSLSSNQARQLIPNSQSLDQCGLALLRQGLDFVLITGTHESTPLVINSLYHEGELLQCYSWERLQYHFHGAGDTLSAAIAAVLAHDTEPQFAVQEAQEFTWECLNHSQDQGIGPNIPHRLFWARNRSTESNSSLN